VLQLFAVGEFRSDLSKREIRPILAFAAMKVRVHRPRPGRALACVR
jgi:hypothetical protein